jgi:hypothetical protein
LEVRTSTRGSGISKSFVAACAVVATIGLGVTAGVVAKNLSAPAASPTHIVQVAPLSSLQVDTRGIIPAEAFGPTTQLVPNSFLGPDAQERNSQLAATMRVAKPHGYI